MVSKLLGYRDDKGRLEIEVELESGPSRVFVVREDELYEGELTFVALPSDVQPSWKSHG